MAIPEISQSLDPNRSASSWLVAHRRNVILVLTTLFAAFLRLYHLGTEPLWLDEAITWQFAAGPISAMFADCHSPLYYLITGAVLSVAGVSEFTLRLPAAIFGILTVPLVYLLARAADRSEPVALLAAAIFALSSWAIWSSQEARMYSMVTFTAALFLYWYLRTEKAPVPFNQYILGVTAALLILSQYLAAILVIVVGAYALLAGRRWWQPVIALTICLAPVILQIVAEAGQYVGHKSFGYSGISYVIMTMVSVSGRWMLIPVFSMMFIIGIIAIARQNRSMAAFCAAACIMPLLALAIAGEWIQMMPRYAIFILPLGSIVLASVIDIPQRHITTGLSAVLIISALIGTGYYYSTVDKPAWPDIADMVSSSGASTVAVIPAWESIPLKYYLAGRTECIDIDDNPDTVIVAPSEIFTDWNRTTVAGWKKVSVDGIEIFTKNR